MTAERIRVLRVIARMNVGGPALQISGLARGLDAERFEQRILCGQVEEGEADWLTLRAPDVEVVRVPGLARSVGATRELVALRAIREQVKQFQPHIVHTHAAKAGVLGRLAARGSDAATVHTFHGHLLHGYFGRMGTTAVRGVERSLAKRTTRLVAVGARVRDELVAAGIGQRARYTVVPPGLELPPSPARDVARKQLGLPADAPVIAYVARLTAIKRPDRLLATLRLLKQTMPDAITLIVGDGPLAEQVRAGAAELGDSVRMLGWRADIETIYAAADVALLTSDNEGTPVALIEAGLCGVPAVSTTVGSVSEVVVDGKSGLLTGPSPQELAEALSLLLQHPVLVSAMGTAARAHMQKHFSLLALVKAHEALYCELVHGPGGT